MIVTLDDCKLHLGFTADDNVDDLLITEKAEAAQSHLERRLGYRLDERYPPTDDSPASSTVPEDLKEAVLSLMAHYYENREGSLVGVSGQTTPLSVVEIIRAYRDWWPHA